MIELERVQAWDTFAYEHLDFRFEPGVHSITGANGASKSSLWMTIFQCFYNRNPKGLKVDEVSNCITKQPYEIIIDFRKDGDSYSVKNSKKTGKIEIERNGKPIHLRRIPDNLKLIEEIVGADYATALDLIYQSRESTINLLETASDGQRKKFVTRILRLDELDTHLERIKAKEKEIAGKRGKLELLNQQIEALENGLGVILDEEEESDLAPLEKRRDDLAKEHAELLQEHYRMEREKAEIDEAITRYEQNEEVLQEIAAKEQLLREMTTPTVSLEDLEEEKERLEGLLADRRFEFQELRGVINRYEAKQRERDRLVVLEREREGIQLPPTPQSKVEETIEKLRQLETYCATNLSRLQKELETFRKAKEQGVCPTCQRGLADGNLDGEITTREGDFTRFTEKGMDGARRLREYTGLLDKYHTFNRLTSEIERIKAAPETNIDIDATRKRFAEVDKAIEGFIETIESLKFDIDRHRIYAQAESACHRLRAKAGPKIEIEDLKLESTSLDIKLTTHTRQMKEVSERHKETEWMLETSRELNATTRARKELNRQTRENNAKVILQLDAAKKELRDTEERLELIRSWVGILGSKGYRVNKMNRFLKHLNVSMKKYSDMVCEGQIQCLFYTTEEGEIDFKITDANKSMSYGGWSGGEKARVKLACLFAVLELLEVIGSVSFSVLALDEIFDALDAKGKEGLFRVLSYLQQRGRCIYTIAHSELTLDKTFDSFIHAEQNPDGTCTLTQ